VGAKKDPNDGESTVTSAFQRWSKKIIVCPGIKFLPAILIAKVPLSQAGIY
jgi:hypothetical protein